MGLNYGKLAEAVREVMPLDTTKAESFAIVKIIFERIAEAVRRGEKVVIPGFGTFQPYYWKPKRMVVWRRKKGGIPIYQEEKIQPGHTRMKFNPSYGMKWSLNGVSRNGKV
jgi:nucleoid DNA-binding protein